MARIKPATFVLDAGEYKDKLPPLHTVVMNCNMDMADYKDMKKNFMLLFPDTQAVAANAGVVTSKLQQMASGFVYAEGKETKWLSDHKFEVLDDLLTENQHANTIIAYQYQAELAELQRRYPRAVTLDEPNAIDRWNAGEIEMLLAHPKSAQFGLNLQFGGHMMIFLSLPWSLTDFEQLIGRLHRSGQTTDVWAYLLVTEKTIDEQILSSLQGKRSIADIAMEALK
jgi:SNF2 family DNA or RNA helicase